MLTFSTCKIRGEKTLLRPEVFRDIGKDAVEHKCHLFSANESLLEAVGYMDPSSPGLQLPNLSVPAGIALVQETIMDVIPSFISLLCCLVIVVLDLKLTSDTFSFIVDFI